MQVKLGNAAPHEYVRDPKTDELTQRALDNPSVTTVDLPGHTVIDALRAITAQGGVWGAHSSEKPSWVWSDDPNLQALLADHFGCPSGMPSKKGAK
ncbi:MAG TPA: hypothetical protein VF244_01570 [Acidimicrobiales bacterium]